jgi:hypothetical protein
MQLLLICEDNLLAVLLDAVTRQTLCAWDRAQPSNWLARDLDGHLQWLGSVDLSQEIAGLFYTRKDDAMLQSKRFPVYGGFPDKVGPDAHAWRRALLWALEQHDSPPDGVLIGIDTDRDPDTCRGLEGACRDEKLRDALTLWCAPNPEAEACLIAGFRPEDDPDNVQEAQRRHRRCRDALGFDPCQHPSRLSSKGGPGDAKKILRLLLLGEELEKPLDIQYLSDASSRCLKDMSRLIADEQLGIVAFQQQLRRLYEALRGEAAP